MQRKDQMDGFGVASLVAFAALLGFNQVVIKFGNEAFQPVFMSGLRSAGAALCLMLFMYLRGIPIRVERRTLPAGLLIGAVFAFEFIFLFLALDLTTVVRVSVIFYTMPLWLALAAHFLLPGDRITGSKALGLLLAFAGVVWAMISREAGAPEGQSASWAGDICALVASIGWAGIALCARGTRLVELPPEQQLLYQLAVSAPLLLGAAFFFGPFLREVAPLHVAAACFQIVVIATFGFLTWMYLLNIYPASSVASFSFLSPVFGVAMGWLFLDEPVGLPLLGALVLVALGLVLINRPARRAVPTPAE